ncbi:hypothetical protein HC891_27130 [Candidatus Gracilibacteria bacterium]|nr:hypothetical protein [Candidatus Gracilibacteria bacterium]
MTVLMDNRADTYTAVSAAILRAVAYADVFDYPLRPPEVQRYLVGVQASLPCVCAILDAGCTGLMRDGDFVMLEGRAQLPEIRRRRANYAARMQPRALAYARRIARLPLCEWSALPARSRLATSRATPTSIIGSLPRRIGSGYVGRWGSPWCDWPASATACSAPII